MRRARLLLLVLALTALVAAAQQPPADSSSAPGGVRLGNSFVTLAGPWKFAPGDSPRVNGSFVWANPAFDDAAWSTLDLHTEGNVTDAAYGDPGYVTGWSAHGFPHLAGFAWYRLRVHIADAGESLWMKMPDHVDDSYQLFANGRFIGQFGKFAPGVVYSYRSRPLVFALPPPDSHGDIVLAIRFYMEPWVLVSGSTGDSGGMHEAPLLGLRLPVEAVLAQEITGRLLSVAVSFFVALFLIIGAAGTFWIWLLDRPRTTYLWLTMGLLFLAAPTLLLLIALFSYLTTQIGWFIPLQICSVLGTVCWVLFWRQWFQLPRERWSDLLIWFVVAVNTFFTLFIQWSAHAPISAIVLAFVVEQSANAVLGIVLFVTLLQGARKDRAGALTAFLPIVLLTISLFSPMLLSWFHIRTSIFFFGIQVAIKDVALVLLVLVTGALVARRFVGSQVDQRLERQAVEQELAQARELQQNVLTPEPVHSPFFSVETVYRPARTVGGDFFQVLSHADGSLLIVVGDVSGKGIAAAMLVAVLVGAIRTRAEDTFDPVTILQALNERLLGRAGEHFATCMAVHLRPGGEMLIANAGHLPPYRNGAAVDLSGSIPLGIVPEARYDLHTMQLDPDDRLTFLTDGVPEARNQAGELLGFDRATRLSSLEPAAIAQAAIDHGQEDDITIVRVWFEPAYAVEDSAILAGPRA